MDGSIKKVKITIALAAGMLVGVSGGALAAPKCSLIIGASENPPVVSDGSGRFRILDVEQDLITYRLRYDIPDPEEGPATNVTQAHIHVANPGNNGGIAVFLCTNLNVSGPPCPTPSGSFEGEFGPGDVLEVTDGLTTVLEAGDFAGLLDLIRDGATYVNVHTNNHSSGEIRCQINPRSR